MRRTATITLALTTALLTACSWWGGHPHGAHGCTLLWTNDEWTDSHFQLYDDDPRSCPLGDTTAIVTAGATIIQTQIGFFVPPPIPTGIATRSLLSIHPTNDACSEVVYAPPVGTTDQPFLYADFLNDGTLQWGVQVWTSYPRGTGNDNTSDCPVYRVRRSNYYFDAIAKTRVHYYGEQW